MSQPVPLPELPQNEWNLSEWKQIVAEESPDQAQFAYGVGETSLTIKVPGNKVRSAVRQILGYSWSTESAPFELFRPEVPIQHPYFGNLWADNVMVSWHRPTTNRTVVYTGGLPNSATTYAAKSLSDDIYPGYGPEFWATYADAHLNIRFKLQNMRMFADWDPEWQLNYVGQEWNRFLRFDTLQPTLEVVAADGLTDESSLYFAETANPAADSGPQTGPTSPPFQGSVYTYKQMSKYVLVWKCVAEPYICLIADPTNAASLAMPEPTRILRALGKVNETPFPGPEGHTPGTLLFESLETDRYQLPVRTDGEFGLFAWDIKMTFTKFDPDQPPDPDWVPNPPAYPAANRVRGHNLFPWRTSQKGWWYYATRGSSTTRGTYNGGPLITYYDFHDIFKHVRAP